MGYNKPASSEQRAASSEQRAASSEQRAASSEQLLVDRRLAGWRTVGFERIVLVVVRTVATLNRLLDILALTETDWRIQTVFTYDPSSPAFFGGGVQRSLDRLGAQIVPWELAIEAEFDLAIAASENDRLSRLKAPVLLVPHGVGYQKYYPSSTVVSGLDPNRLLYNGAVVPAAIALSHARQRQLLEAACPPAAQRSVVVGDPCLERMLASRHREHRYRAQLGADGKRLVTVASTWGPHSLLGTWQDLSESLLSQLPADEYRVAMILHPGIWSAHGQRQVRTWLARAEMGGLLVIPPEQGWQAALLAADFVLSDHGSLSLYAAAIDKPLLLVPDESPTTVEGSALAELAARTARLDPDRDLRNQIDAAIAHHMPGHGDSLLRLVFDEPGRCAQRLRKLIYDLVELAEPVEEAAFAPFMAPVAWSAPAPTLVAGARVSTAEVAVTRFPDLRNGPPHDQLDFRHLVAEVDTAAVAQLDSAAILSVDIHAAEPWSRTADALLARWPRATIVATVVDRRTCRIRTATVAATLTLLDPPAGVDPLLLASLAYARLRMAGSLPQRDRLRIADRVIEVAVATEPASSDRR